MIDNQKTHPYNVKTGDLISARIKYLPCQLSPQVGIIDPVSKKKRRSFATLVYVSRCDV